MIPSTSVDRAHGNGHLIRKNRLTGMIIFHKCTHLYHLYLYSDQSFYFHDSDEVDINSLKTFTGDTALHTVCRQSAMDPFKRLQT